ncbi:MAG: hypothetical protein ACD_71C00132G0006 [uncultured bacterium (gcode 4)]|uniref:Uncharacterized protein n=1 Tax=uncultured bacterium (gcode 4) TaxID=1234023 RepID=K2A338_9BACT|nr:MAG: hypothetical protein ACD_71C00132G0006 [uncultured bacterium (gcode 4)]
MFLTRQTGNPFFVENLEGGGFEFREKNPRWQGDFLLLEGEIGIMEWYFMNKFCI